MHHIRKNASDISTIPILKEPSVTYKVYLPLTDHICPITFLDDDAYGLPYVKNILKSSPIREQLPTQALTQQWNLSLGTDELIHASSAHNELLRLRSTYANKKIQITKALRVIDTYNQFEQERTKFDQMRPILASASITTDHQPLMSTSIKKRT